MLLPALPVLVAVAARCCVTSRRTLLLLSPLMLAAAAWNVRTLELLHAKRETAGRLAAALTAAPEPIVVTDLFWLPTEMAALWDQKQFHLLGRDEDMALLVARASSAGTPSILAAAEPGRIPGDALARIREEMFPAFSVDVHRLALRAADEASPSAATPPVGSP
jgi:hypothetical protein